MTTRDALLVLLAVFVAAPVVRAQEADGFSEPPPASFAGLDRIDAHSRFGADLSYVQQDYADDLSFWRLELYNQLAAKLPIPGTGGGYAQIAIARVFSDRAGRDDISAMSNFEAGGFYVYSYRSLAVALRLGVCLPTADSDADGFGLANSLASFARLTDVADIFPDVTSLRMSVSPIFRHRIFLWRADLGTDIPVAEPPGRDGLAIFRLNAGAAVRLGPLVTILAELINVANVSWRGSDDWWEHTAGLGVDVRAGRVHPRLSVVFPLDQNVREDVSFVVTIGAQGTL